jgi:hypothetical protein
MISSEVQRTLVKSPPELWAELGDPAALARHLGALGEIRITRAEPEKRVEWEAPGTNGVVQIKPSGWGTKVTLSVTREVELAEQPPASAAAGEQQVTDSTAGAEPLAVSSGTPEPGPEYTPEPEQEPEIEDGVEVDAGVEVEEGAEPEDGVEVDDGSEPYDTAVTQAWPAVEAEPEVAAVEYAEPAPEIEIAGDAPVAWPEPLEQATEPRRGFFARLFGRRRPQVDTMSPDDVDARPDTTEGSFEADAEQATAQTGDEQPQPAARSSAIELLQARFAPATAAAARAAGAGPAVAIAPGAVEPEAAQPEPVEPEAAEPETAQPEAGAPEAAAPESVEPEAAQPVDLAAELQAAEEVAAEEVRAVLTAVLDRLGAAHHRPFSRA